MSQRAASVSTGTFTAGPDTRVVSEDLDELLDPGHEGNGWLAQGATSRLGYKGDAAKTAKTFPSIDGVAMRCPATVRGSSPAAPSSYWAATR